MSKLRNLLSSLQDEGYVERNANDKFDFTDKFYRDLTTEDEASQSGHVFEVALIEKRIQQLPKTLQDWQLAFMKFIEEAEVPKVCLDNRGEAYYTNKYSEPAMKVWRKAIEKEGVLYPVLVKSVMLYYKSSVGFKKAIGNYFVQGDWRSDYEAMLQAASTGAKELKQHINEEVKTHERDDGWNWG